MAVYTCFDMIADCKANKSEGWTYLSKVFIPPLEWMVKRYGGGQAHLATLLASLKPFPREIAPMAEREFIAAIRPHILDSTGWTGGEAQTLALTQFESALTELTPLERQLVWFEVLGYSIPDAARLCRVSAETATKSQDRASDLLRQSLDRWDRAIVRDNAAILAREARAAVPGEPVPFRGYLDIIDGRMTWSNRMTVERSLSASWFEVDHFCRVREADAAMRDTKPLTDEQAAPYVERFGVRLPKPSLWKRVIAAR